MWERGEIYKDAFIGLVVQVWKKEVESLEFNDSLVIGERVEDGGTLLQSLEEEKDQSRRYWNFEVWAVSYNGF